MSFADDRQLIVNAQADALATARTYLDNLNAIANASLIEGTTVLPESYNFATVPTINPIYSVTGSPALDTAVSAPPDAPTTSFSTITDVAVPEFDTAAPVLNLPVAPSATLPDAPATAPSFDTPDIPTAPTVSLPPVPTFEALALPDAPSVNLPTFVGALPTDDLLAPTAEFAFAEAAYSSTLLDPLKAKLLDNLVNGGYGIETADEVALFNRARDREVEAMLSRVQDAGRAMAARGFPLPPGELSIHIDRAYQDMQNKVSDASRDITLQRNKLFVENRQFTIEQVKGLEQILIGFHNSVQERALNVARLTVEMSIAVFEALVKRYVARLDAYKSEATAFAERIRGELAKAEIYRTQIEAKNVQVSMQRQLVETYLAQLKGIEFSVDIYKVQMEAARVRAEIERTKLEAYRYSVDAYTAQVQAKVAEFGAYRAQIEGETAKVTAFDSQVRAYGGQVAAAKTKADIQLGKLQSETEQARVQLAGYQGQIEGYKANVQRLLDTGRLVVDRYRSDVDASRSFNDVMIAKAGLQEKALEAATTQNIEISKMTIENARVRLLGVIESLKFKTEAAKFGSHEYFAVLSALSSSVNTLSVTSATQ